MRLGPRNTQNPEVERLVSGQPAQYVSENAWRAIELEDIRKAKPKSKVPLRYLKIHFASMRWDIHGALMNCATWCTAYEIFGLVIVRYWSEPTSRRYFVASENKSPSRADSCDLALNGVLQGLHSVIMLRRRRSIVYFVKGSKISLPPKFELHNDRCPRSKQTVQAPARL